MTVEDSVRKAEKEIPREIEGPLFDLGRLLKGYPSNVARSDRPHTKAETTAIAEVHKLASQIGGIWYALGNEKGRRFPIKHFDDPYSEDTLDITAPAGGNSVQTEWCIGRWNKDREGAFTLKQQILGFKTPPATHRWPEGDPNHQNPLLRLKPPEAL